MGGLTPMRCVKQTALSVGFLHSTVLLWLALRKKKNSPVLHVRCAEHLHELALALPQCFMGLNGAIVKNMHAQSPGTHSLLCRSVLHDSVFARARLFAAAATELLHNWWTVVISVLIVASGRARVCLRMYVSGASAVCLCSDLWAFKCQRQTLNHQVFRKDNVMKQRAGFMGILVHGGACTFLTCLCHPPLGVKFVRIKAQ